MKLFATFLAATAFAQTTETTTGLSELERGKKKKKKQQDAYANEPDTTVAPDTTTPYETTTGTVKEIFKNHI